MIVSIIGRIIWFIGSIVCTGMIFYYYTMRNIEDEMSLDIALWLMVIGNILQWLGFIIARGLF